MKPIISLFLMIFCINVIAEIHTVRLLNKGQPLAVNLTIDKEVQIIFATNIDQIAIPAGLQNKISVQSIDKRAWFRAVIGFSEAKFLVKDTKGKIIVLLLSASKTINRHQNYQVVNEANKPQAKSVNIKKIPRVSYVDMTRFVAQTLYAPKRLIKDIGLVKVPVNPLVTNLFACYDNVLLCNNSIVITPIVAYRNKQGNYITALKITNKDSNYGINLDPRAVRGNFLAASFHFDRLGKSGNNSDTSVLYLISKQTFRQSL